RKEKEARQELGQDIIGTICYYFGFIYPNRRHLPGSTTQQAPPAKPQCHKKEGAALRQNPQQPLETLRCALALLQCCTPVSRWKRPDDHQLELLFRVWQII